LSLPDDVRRFILRHLSRADGKLKALLNLRETCSVTKEWIGDLQEMKASRLFSQGQAFFNMEEDEDITLFLNTLPPHYIKSLRLIMSNGQPKQDTMMEQRDDDHWKQLLDFWKPQNRRLECLQIFETLSSSLNSSRLVKFMEESKVKSIQFFNYSVFNAFPNQPKVLMKLEEILSDESITEPASDLMETLPLKKLQVPIQLRSQYHITRFSL